MDINKEWLNKKYIDEQLTIREISTETGIPSRTIHSWLVKHDIPRRKGGVKSWSEEQKELRRNWNKNHPEIIRMKGKKHSEATKEKMSKARQGENNGNWKNGVTTKIRGIRRSPQYYQWRKKVFERDGYTCQQCGSTQRLNGHHIKPILDYPELIFDTTNGITLCEQCHIQTRVGGKRT